MGGVEITVSWPVFLLGSDGGAVVGVSPNEDSENEPRPTTPRNFAEVLTKAKQSCASMLDVCKKLSGLSLNDTETLDSLNDLSSQYQSSSLALFDGIKTAFEGQSITGEDVDKFAVLLEKVLSSARLLAALLRKADLGEHDTANHHYLSAEFGDSWGGVTEIVSRVRSVDGDSEDVNYLMRARAIENQLADAVQNEPKLVISNAKIASLEKVRVVHNECVDGPWFDAIIVLITHVCFDCSCFFLAESFISIQGNPHAELAHC